MNSCRFLIDYIMLTFANVVFLEKGMRDGGVLLVGAYLSYRIKKMTINIL